MILHEPPYNMRKISSKLGLTFDNTRKCIVIWQATQIGNMDPLWGIKKEILSLQELMEDTSLIEKIRQNNNLDLEIAWFCFDMGWTPKNK